jgi:hypothetical protein
VLLFLTEGNTAGFVRKINNCDYTSEQRNQEIIVSYCNRLELGHVLFLCQFYECIQSDCILGGVNWLEDYFDCLIASRK